MNPTTVMYGLVGGLGVVILYVIVDTLLDWYRWTRTGALAATFYTATGDTYRARVYARESEGGVETFEWRKHLYRVPQPDDRSKKDKTGYAYRPLYRSRVTKFITAPHAVYVEGIADPVDVLKQGTKGVTVDQLDILGEQHIVSDALKAFAHEVMSPIMIAVMLGILVIATGFGVYHFTTDKVSKTVASAMLGQVNTETQNQVNAR